MVDLWRTQTSADKWIEAFCDLMPIGRAEEQGQIRAGIGPFLEGARYVPMRAPWYPEFRLLNDDQVDALGLIGQVLTR